MMQKSETINTFFVVIKATDSPGIFILQVPDDLKSRTVFTALIFCSIHIKNVVLLTRMYRIDIYTTYPHGTC